MQKNKQEEVSKKSMEANLTKEQNDERNFWIAKVQAATDLLKAKLMNQIKEDMSFAFSMGPLNA